jgi:hypothetical protein
LAGVIAHDFNNLLVTIIGNADLSLDQLDPASPTHASLREIPTLATPSKSARHETTRRAPRSAARSCSPTTKTWCGALPR